MSAALVLVAVLAAATPAADHHDATARHSFDDVAHWVKIFDDPKRDEWQKPAEVVSALGLKPGMTVADLGSGTGYFSRYLSRAVGDGGTVFAIEIEPKLLAHLRDRAEKEQTANLVPILGSLDDARLPPASVDVILIADTIHHIDDRPEYLRRLRRALKPGGRVAVVDFKKEESPVGPPIAHRLARQLVVEAFDLAGYRLIGEPTFLPYQYFLVFGD